jgi:hypothetical protein
MIKSVTSSSQHLYASGGSSLPYVSSNMSNPMQGMLRINGSEMEVFDGQAWMKIYMSDANVGLSSTANSAIDWAIQRMGEETEWYRLASNSEAVRIALEQLEQARERLELTAILAREYERLA